MKTLLDINPGQFAIVKAGNWRAYSLHVVKPDVVTAKQVKVETYRRGNTSRFSIYRRDEILAVFDTEAETVGFIERADAIQGAFHSAREAARRRAEADFEILTGELKLLGDDV